MTWPPSCIPKTVCILTAAFTSPISPPEIPLGIRASSFVICDLMSFASDLRILYHLALKPVRGHDHAARMENFYAGQAAAYDDFRKRLLKGRQELWNLIPPPPGGTWIDMGGGTGANLDYFGDSISRLGKVYVLDLSHSLLEIAKQRSAAKGWTNVETIEADATTFRPPSGP